jgi:LPS-assembly lipoprotein
MRRALALALCFALAACGFRPMYGRSLGPALSSIYVEPIAEREGYELRNSLIDALQSDGDKAGKAYRLKITLNESSQGIALQNDCHHHPLQQPPGSALCPERHARDMN